MGPYQLLALMGRGETAVSDFSIICRGLIKLCCGV